MRTPRAAPFTVTLGPVPPAPGKPPVSTTKGPGRLTLAPELREKPVRSKASAHAEGARPGTSTSPNVRVGIGLPPVEELPPSDEVPPSETKEPPSPPVPPAEAGASGRASLVQAAALRSQHKPEIFATLLNAVKTPSVAQWFGARESSLLE